LLFRPRNGLLSDPKEFGGSTTRIVAIETSLSGLLENWGDPYKSGAWNNVLRGSPYELGFCWKPEDDPWFTGDPYESWPLKLLDATWGDPYVSGAEIPWELKGDPFGIP
jgi:hypothetical protein